ncbi:MAG: hypothetical protein V3R78_15280 [Thermodesulfobacteriota bacterium]
MYISQPVQDLPFVWLKIMTFKGLLRSSNIMIDKFGDPHIVDWAAAITSEEFSIYLLRIIYKNFIEDDFKAVIKLKMCYCTGGLTDEEKRNYAHRRITEPATRAIRDVARRCRQRIA